MYQINEVIEMETIVKTTDLSKYFGKHQVIKSVNLNVPKGQVYGFLGPNGAGKTTVIKMLLSLTKASSGQISIFDKNLKSNRINILREVGSLVENPSYYGHLTAYENLEVFRRILGVNKARSTEVLETVGLSHTNKKRVKNFSLGMKHRLGIGIALLGDPELLILDEPTNGLDPSGIQEIRSLIQNLAKKENKTIIISSHLLSEIDQVADYVGIISKGRLIYQDRIHALRTLADSTTEFKVSNRKTAETLIKNNYEIDLNQEHLRVKTTDEDAVSDIISTLVKHDVKVYGAKPVIASLEDIFLKIIEESEGDRYVK